MLCDLLQLLQLLLLLLNVRCELLLRAVYCRHEGVQGGRQLLLHRLRRHRIAANPPPKPNKQPNKQEEAISSVAFRESALVERASEAAVAASGQQYCSENSGNSRHIQGGSTKETPITHREAAGYCMRLLRR